MDENFKSWTVQRKAAPVMGITLGKTWILEASRSFDHPHSQLEGWVKEGKHGLENASPTI